MRVYKARILLAIFAAKSDLHSNAGHVDDQEDRDTDEGAEAEGDGTLGLLAKVLCADNQRQPA